MPTPARLAHIVLPRELRRSRTINLAPRIASTAYQPSKFKLELSAHETAFLAWLFQQANLDASSYRVETQQRRLTACLRALRVADVYEARLAIRTSPHLLQVALSALLVGVTSFFRDTAVFESLRTEIIPSLAQQRGGLFVWSAGCSEGAELYSVALMLAQQNLLGGSYLLGTDCRGEAIERAKRGCYDTSSLKAVPADLLASHFEQCGTAWQVCDAVRQAMRWRVANILASNEPGLWDLIFFRNTAMYLRPECTDRMWERLERSLRPGGILVLGNAERPLGAKRLALIAPCLYRRVRK